MRTHVLHTLTFLTFIANTKCLIVEPPFLFIDEDWPVGSCIPVAICPSHKNLRIHSGDPQSTLQVVKFNETCATIRLKKALDADMENADGTRWQSFSLILESGRERGTLEMQVVDVNDNAPQFQSFPSRINISEKTNVGRVIGTVKTFDPDTGIGGMSRFFIEGEKFSMDRSKCANSYCTATVKLKSALDFESQSKHDIIIIARDGASRTKLSNEARLSVTINVIDEQDTPPVFITNSSYGIAVEEGRNVNERVYQIQAEDGDKFAAKRNQITYEISENEYFGIEEDSGWLVLKSHLDRESLVVIEIVIKAIEKGEEGMWTEQKFVINVTDSDDVIPKCERSFYFFEMEEGAKHFIESESIHVFDNDQGENAEFSVLLSGHFSNLFKVHPSNVDGNSSLIISIANDAEIDYERTRSINLTLNLEPEIQTSEAGKCNVLITINDRNDNAPSFSLNSSTLHIIENSEPQKIGIFQATDADSTFFLPIVYQLSGPGAEYFSIDDKGVLTSKKKFDREELDEYKLILNAIDSAGKGLRSSINLTIVIDDENDNAPKFGQEAYFLMLNEETESRFALKATDVDIGDNGKVKYSTVNNMNVSVDAVSGMISLPKFDAELLENLTFTIFIMAADHGEKPLLTVVPVHVTIRDMNDHDPYFVESFLTAKVNHKSRGVIANATALDEDKTDANNRIHYRLEPIMEYFSVNENTGEVSIKKTPDGSVEHWEMDVIAEDNGNPARGAKAKLLIRYKDREKITFERGYFKVEIYENTTANSTIYKPKTSKESDEVIFIFGGELNVTWVRKPKEILKWLSIDGQTGSVILVEEIDGDEIDRLDAIIILKDSKGNLLDTAVLVVSVLDVNDNFPRFENASYSTEIVENAPLGEHIVTVRATDADKSDSLRYSIASSSEKANLLEVDNDGNIRVAGDIDFEKQSKISCSVIVQDQAGNVAVVNVTIAVLDANDCGPEFVPSSVFNVSVMESIAPGSVLDLSYPLARDADSGLYGKITYSLLSGNDFFAIDSSTSQITLESPLDFESQKAHSIAVRAVDGGNKSRTSNEAFASVTVHVLDVNDNSPVFIPAVIPLLKIREDEKVGVVLTRLSATDADCGPAGEVSFAITNSSGIFNLERNGVLKLARQLESKAGSKFCEGIKATDSGDPSLSSIQTVCVLVIPARTNKAMPLILWPEENSIHFFDENVNYEELLKISVAAGDTGDGDNDLLFGIVELRNQDWRSFSINNTGSVFVNRTFDYEQQKQYELRIQVCDFSNNCAEVTTFIAVNDLNDHCPEFRQTSANLSIYENGSVKNGSTLVGFFPAAVDMDGSSSNRNICYNVASASHSSLFFVDRTSPTLFVRQSLDREECSQHKLTLSAFDCNNACNDVRSGILRNISVTLVVGDINDNFPRFRERVFYGGAIQGRSQPGDKLLAVIADDPDIEENGLFYEIKGNIRNGKQIIPPASSPVFINSSTGEIFSNLFFRIESSSVLNFYVTVRDGIGHEDEAFIMISVVSYEQQLELIFDADTRFTGDEQLRLRRLLSEATSLTAVIDNVMAKINSTILMVHFLDTENSFVPAEIALRNLDREGAASQRSARNILFADFGLRKAEQIKIAKEFGSIAEAIGPVVYGVLVMLLLLLTLSIIACCRQRWRLSRKLRAVAAANYAQTIRTHQLPGTNLHSKEPNPLWDNQNRERSVYPQQLMNSLQSTEL